ncbi:MAG: UDP-N-acetylmuramoylalanine--D-glutamate ligase [Candidatus Kentron sp. G]|nr:MAG: UDP-N-acetylmuramoylalanine--D-glutamate ligase [Candidatus Kentron sp. G]VFM97391.1 MAG: UDP-N-acetylmuramoylalanine--D-glutamate ligase [Candidatus Kentron sp. G]VFM99967.1 MAG: UDP-N-acetylmuramoylalanine--D-glutamate ligase [Candidatus Kentron sp. G]
MNICERISDPLAIIGFGHEGRSLLNLFLAKCPNISIDILSEDRIDLSIKEEYKDNKRINFREGADCLKRLPEYTQVFRSPGVSIYKEELIHAVKQGVNITSSAQLWHDLYRRDHKIIVTGTKGKSTTSALLHYVLDGCGEDVVLAGNIGIPLADLILSGESHRYWVVEMSSYQLSDFSGTPEIAVLTNLYAEHVDWHRGLENYFRDKSRLFYRLEKGRAVLNRRDINTGKWIGHIGEAVYFNDDDGFYVTDRGISYKNEHILSGHHLKIMGEHNLENICATLSVTNMLGIGWEETLEYISEFKGLPHRMEIVEKKNGVFYVDDSISTIPESTMNAIRVFLPRPITVIVGGYDRGLDWNGFGVWLAQSSVNAVIGVPESGWIIVDSINSCSMGGVSGFYAQGMEEALHLSRRITPKEGVVLLSPASPSYNIYTNYKDRGRHFRSLIGGQ